MCQHFQEHLMSRSTFRNCGFRSDKYAEYDDSEDRGCGENNSTGCEPGSSVFGFLTHSDLFTPEVMQASKNITFESCGRRFRLDSDRPADDTGEAVMDTVAGRAQNWLDADGTASGLNEPTFIVSGLASVKSWLEVDGDGKVTFGLFQLSIYLCSPNVNSC